MSYIEDKVNLELRKFAVSKQVFCPVTETILHARTVVIVEIRRGQVAGRAVPRGMGSARCRDPRGHAHRRRHQRAEGALSMALKRVCLGTIWVCTDCYLDHDGTGEPAVRTGDEPQTWSLVDDDTEVTAGMLFAEHSCERPDEDECDCQVVEFSKSSCDGCGSPLHGHREAMTLWARRTN
jgi:hypothetical protein